MWACEKYDGNALIIALFRAASIEKGAGRDFV
jgi:hypothetical protein